MKVRQALKWRETTQKIEIGLLKYREYYLFWNIF